MVKSYGVMGYAQTFFVEATDGDSTEELLWGEEVWLPPPNPLQGASPQRRSPCLNPLQGAPLQHLTLPELSPKYFTAVLLTSFEASPRYSIAVLLALPELSPRCSTAALLALLEPFLLFSVIGIVGRNNRGRHRI